jgi:uncharacterized protein
MPQPLVTTNDADISKLEGLYIKERNPPASIVEASLNAVGVFGVTMRGPVDKVVVITSESRFLEIYGGGYVDGVLVNKVWKSLLNKGMSKLYVARVAAADAVKASFTMETLADGTGTQVLRADASSVGAWGSKVKFKVKAATDADANHFDLDVKDTITGRVYEYKNLNITVGNNNILTVLGTDDGNLITLTKLADGRPIDTAGIAGADADGFLSLGQVVASFVSVAGSDGALVDGDYFAASRGLNLLKSYPGVGIIYPAEYMSANLKAQIKTAAAASSDRIFLIGANDDTVNVAAAIADVPTYRGDRMVYCYNHVYTIDPVTGTETITYPQAWMAAILANTDVDIHPGEEDTKRYLAGITRLDEPALTRQDYVDLRAAGISALETDLGSPVFVSGVTTDLTSGKTEITRRRMADFLQLSVAQSLRFTVKKKNTQERRLANVGMIKAFLKDLQKAGRVVESYEVDGEILNTPSQRAAGIEKILMRVKLLGHMLHVVIETEIGTGVTITVQ